MERLNRVLAFVIFIFSVEIEQMKAQCPGAETCEDAYVFCSLDELNGFSCQNASVTLGTCEPPCQAGTILTYRTWWAFVSQGGNVSFTFNVGACPIGTSQYLFLAILGDCHCGEEIFCGIPPVASNGSATYQINLIPCKIYYLYIDGGLPFGPCDFTLNTSGGGPPPLSLGFINDISNGTIEPVCRGVCDFRFFVNPKAGGCDVSVYEWTLDDNKVGGNANEIKLDFPDAGDFKICVTAYVGNLVTGQICSPEGPKCATVKVRDLPDKTGAPRILCFEQINPGGYQWHSQYIFNSGIYKEELKENNCCKYDSVVKFTVLPEPLPSDVYYISCDNKPYIDILGHKWSPCLKNFLVPLPKTSDILKCDSSIRLTAVNVEFAPQWHAKCAGGKVEISPNINILKPCSVGETYQFDYRWYKKNDTLQKTISTNERLLVDAVNEDYCLEVKVQTNIDTLSVTCFKIFCDTINEADLKAKIINVALTFCDSTTINGRTYTQSDSFIQNLKNVFGCDSIVNTEINIKKSNSTDITKRGCDSIILNNQVFTQSGSYKQMFTNVNNCDSILNLQLDIGKTSFSNLIQNACDSISINNQVYKFTGVYQQLLLNASGCDSILNLDITIQPGSQTDINKTDCDSVVFNGKIYKLSGDYPERYTGANGCDSIIVLHVNIPNSNTSPLILSRCDTVTINGKLYNQSGNYSQKLISANGCDSILNIELEIWKSGEAEIGRQECDSAVINNITYYQSGIYQQKLQTTAGCDSTLNIDLSIAKSSSGDTLYRSCDSVTINGITYHQTGIYEQTLVNATQCDSILIIDFTRLSKTSTAISLRSCDSLTVNSQVYKQSGNYTQTFVNANQCDSILNLKVEISKSNSADLNLVSCDSAWVNGQLYTQTGNYIQALTNAEQCDSLLNINLIINKSISVDYPLRACDSADINGKIYKQSGNYTQNLKTVNLCDSIVNLQIEIRKSGEAEIGKEACDSIIINNISYTQSGIYQQILQSTNGCDSTLTLDLIIKPGNPSTLDAGVDTSICEGEIIKLNGVFNGLASFKWQGARGNFDFPDRLSTNFYSNTIGNQRIYLSAEDDCKQWLDSLNLQILPNQFVQVSGDTIIDPCKDKEIRFTATGGNNYTWTPTSNIECLDPPCSHVLLKSNLASRFTITTDGPCAFPANLNLSLSQTQSDVYLPNAFSPNGDNINDVFLPIFNCDQVTFFNLQIFDRWGNLLYESQNKYTGWNGNYQDVKMNPGVYPYVIEYKVHGGEMKVKTGDVTLVR